MSDQPAQNITRRGKTSEFEQQYDEEVKKIETVFVSLLSYLFLRQMFFYDMCMFHSFIQSDTLLPEKSK